MIPHNKWPEADEKEAVRLWETGMSASQISKAMGGKYSRSAVLGKMSRAGRLRAPQPKPPKKEKVKMTIEDRIRYRHLSRQSPSEIGATLHMLKAEVIAKLIEMGLDPRDNVPEPYHVHPMWNMEEDARRAEFVDKYERGMKAVRQRLREDRLQLESSK